MYHRTPIHDWTRDINPPDNKIDEATCSFLSVSSSATQKLLHKESEDKIEKPWRTTNDCKTNTGNYALDKESLFCEKASFMLNFLAINTLEYLLNWKKDKLNLQSK